MAACTLGDGTFGWWEILVGDFGGRFVWEKCMREMSGRIVWEK